MRSAKWLDAPVPGNQTFRQPKQQHYTFSRVRNSLVPTEAYLAVRAAVALRVNGRECCTSHGERLHPRLTAMRPATGVVEESNILMAVSGRGSEKRMLVSCVRDQKYCKHD